MAHLYCLDLMSDLSTLFSDKSVDPDDRCLNTLGSLVHVLYEVLARTVGETRLRGTNITIGQQPQGLVGTNIINIIKIEN